MKPRESSAPPPAYLSKVLSTLEDKKALDIRVLDMREVVSYTDFLVLCSGTSSTHVSALVSALEEAFPGAEGPVHTNGSKDDSWWILDFVEVVVHVFKEDARRFYDLENLWADSTPLEI